jgi:hypothetical protein
MISQTVGRRCRQNPETTTTYLDVRNEQSYSAPMINAATIVIARRRRTLAVWADVCV